MWILNAFVIRLLRPPLMWVMFWRVGLRLKAVSWWRPLKCWVYLDYLLRRRMFIMMLSLAGMSYRGVACCLNLLNAWGGLMVVALLMISLGLLLMWWRRVCLRVDFCVWRVLPRKVRKSGVDFLSSICVCIWRRLSLT